LERKNRLPAVHPGEIIREDILPEGGLSVTDAAKALGVSRQVLHDILAQRKPLSAVMSLKISRLLGSTPEFWIRLQADFSLKQASANQDVMKRVRPGRASEAGRGSARLIAALGTLTGGYTTQFAH
jgi:addiction module HigA family antidote